MITATELTAGLKTNVDVEKALSPGNCRTVALRALENYLGDNLYRARRAFSGSNLDEEYGESGKTKRQILAEYEQHEAEVKAAIAWVRSK
jgi:hypothetical protein